MKIKPARIKSEQKERVVDVTHMTYADVVNMVYKSLKTSDGITPGALARVERQLVEKLPPVLREHYLTAGKHRGINSGFNRILQPAALRHSPSGVLIFCEEHQGVVFWGIKPSDMKSADPPVFQSAIQAKDRWFKEADHLSAFLKRMLFWQAVNGGLPFGEAAEIDRKQLALIERSHIRLVLDEPCPMAELRIYKAHDDGVLCVAGKSQPFVLCIGANKQKSVIALLEEIGIEL